MDEPAHCRDRAVMANYKVSETATVASGSDSIMVSVPLGKWSAAVLAKAEGTRRAGAGSAIVCSAPASSASASSSSPVWSPCMIASASDRQVAVVISSRALTWKLNCMRMNAPSSATEIEVRPKLDSGSSGLPSSWPHSSATLAAICATTASWVSWPPVSTANASWLLSSRPVRR